MAVTVQTDPDLIPGLNVSCTGLTAEQAEYTPCDADAELGLTRIMDDTLALYVEDVFTNTGWNLWAEVDVAAEPPIARVCRYAIKDDFRHVCYGACSGCTGCAVSGLFVLDHIPQSNEDVSSLAGALEVTFDDGVSIGVTF